MPVEACIPWYCWLGWSPKACVAVIGSCAFLLFVSFFCPGPTESMVGRQNIAPNSARPVSEASLSAFLGVASSLGPGLIESIAERQPIPPTLVSSVCLSLRIRETSTQ